MSKIAKDAKIYVAGHRGLVGSAIVKNLQAKGYANIVTRTHKELDLIDSVAVRDFFEQEKPDYVFLAAAKVGGIEANNTYRAEFLYDNLMIQNNVVHQSYLHGVRKLMFLGSTCIYPKKCPQPMKEQYLLTDTLEYTNEPYAIAKIAGIKLCESYNLQYGTNFISVMPTNLYGPNDNFHFKNSHVLPALLRKIHLGSMLEQGKWEAIKDDLQKRPDNETESFSTPEAMTKKLEEIGINKDPDGNVRIEIWGSGSPRREFLWSEDMADACVYIMERVNFADTYSSEDNEIRNTHINIGTGVDISILELANLIKERLGFQGSFKTNPDKPDGTMKKLTDVTKLHGLGWRHNVELKDGIDRMYDWYLKA